MILLSTPILSFDSRLQNGLDVVHDGFWICQPPMWKFARVGCKSGSKVLPDGNPRFKHFANRGGDLVCAIAVWHPFGVQCICLIFRWCRPMASTTGHPSGSAPGLPGRDVKSQSAVEIVGVAGDRLKNGNTYSLPAEAVVLKGPFGSLANGGIGANVSGVRRCEGLRQGYAGRSEAAYSQ